MTVYLPPRFPTIPFARCLESLPNLHTLEIGWVDGPYARPLGKALRGIELPQIKTLILPPTVNVLLKHCPDVEDVVCVVGGVPTYRLDALLIRLASNKDSKVKRLAIPLMLWNDRSSKRFSFLYSRQRVGTITDCLQSRNMWPGFQSSPSSPSSTLILSTPTKPQERELYLTRLRVHALIYWN